MMMMMMMMMIPIYADDTPLIKMSCSFRQQLTS